MQVPPEITVKGVTMTPYIEKLITKGLTKLEEVCDYIISTRIALEQAQGRHQRGNPYRMRIGIRVPNRPEIVVKRLSTAIKKTPDEFNQRQTPMALEGEPELERSQFNGRSALHSREVREEPLTAFIRRTFDTAQRELEKIVDRQHGEVKTPASRENSAVVEKIFREQGYGFLRTMDGQQVYFHRNSLLHKYWESLSVGTIVRYAPEIGENGLQASTVEPIDKPGVAESHDQLHDLPAVSSPHRRTVRAGRTAG